MRHVVFLFGDSVSPNQMSSVRHNSNRGRIGAVWATPISCFLSPNRNCRKHSPGLSVKRTWFAGRVRSGQFAQPVSVAVTDIATARSQRVLGSIMARTSSNGDKAGPKSDPRAMLKVQGASLLAVHSLGVNLQRTAIPALVTSALNQTRQSWISPPARHAASRSSMMTLLNVRSAVLP